MTDSAVVRFWAKVEKSPACWVWIGSKNNFGYGHFRVDGRHQYAHRVSLAIHGVVIPKGAHVDHLCRNPSCVRPDHLEPVACAENARRGLRAKLKKAEVVEIWKLINSGEKSEDIARRFGVSAANIANIRTGRVWAKDMPDIARAPPQDWRQRRGARTKRS